MSFTVSHKQAKNILQVNLKANNVCMLTGSPAMGKSSIIRQLADENNLHLIDLRLTQLQPYDLNGLISPNKDTGKFDYLPYDEFILDFDTVPNGKDGVLLFLDEFNSADKYTAAAAYKLLLDRMVGKYQLHPNTRIICAGNKLTDGAITHKLGTAIQSRVIHMELELDIKEWLDWLDSQNWNPLIHPFLSFRPELINNFDPKTEVVTYASPRTWEFLSNQLNAGLLSLNQDDYIPAIIGTVGEQAGQEFISFLSVFSKLPTIQEIEANPTQATMPDEIGAKWALGIHLANEINPTNETAVVEYMERMPESDIRVVAYRILSKTYPQIKMNPVLQQSMKNIRQQMAA